MPKAQPEFFHTGSLGLPPVLSLDYSTRYVPIKAKTGAGEKQAQISLSYLLNKDFRKVGPNENEGNTHLLVVGW